MVCTAMQNTTRTRNTECLNATVADMVVIASSRMWTPGGGGGGGKYRRGETPPPPPPPSPNCGIFFQVNIFSINFRHQ